MNVAACGLYVHLPWCVRKCPYCDFNSFEARGTLAEGAYVSALLRDLDVALAGLDEVPLITSIFFGGGTPSLFSAAAIARLLEGINARCRIDPAAEITLEANPGTAEATRFRGYIAAGVNRLSLGIQSFNPQRLQALGRIHDGREALAAIDIARGAGCNNLNLDLMFGLPGDQPGDSLLDLDQAIACAPEHISWYQLTLEEGTAFAQRPPALPAHDQICDDYDAGLVRLDTAGYRQYEISAYARSGRAARHNLNYWLFGDYLGIGAGAHGKRTQRDGTVWRSARVRNPERYMRAALAGTATETDEQISGSTLATEFMLNALRLHEGFAARLFETRTGLPLARIAAPLAAAQARGWLEIVAGQVRPTAHGSRFLNDLQLLFTALADADADPA